MEPPTPISFRFSDLPSELALLIFKYAARPTFDQPETYAAKNPYLDAILLSRVSKTVRRTVLLEILHTVLLPEAHHVVAFEQALRMQKTYVEQQQHDLILDYTSCVHRMWIGLYWEHLGGPFEEPIPGFDNSDVKLLASVILAVPSLAFDVMSLHVLSYCLRYACKSNTDLDIEHIDSPLPWRTKSLTVYGGVPYHWWSFIGNIEGYTFITSITHLTLLYSDGIEHADDECACQKAVPDFKPYVVPSEMARAPFEKLQTFSMIVPSSTDATGLELVTFPASLLPHHWTLQEIVTYRDTEVGIIPSIPLPVTCSQVCVFSLDCERMWACGFEGPSSLVRGCQPHCY